MSGPRPPFIALRERLSKTVREVAQNAQTAFNELGSLDAVALVSTASPPAVPRHTDARTPGAEEVIRLPVSAARKLRFYDRADLVELIRQHLGEKAALLDENAALRRLVSDKLGDTALQEALQLAVPTSGEFSLTGDSVRATEDGVQRFLVLAAHAEIVRLKSDAATTAAASKAETEQLRDELVAAQAEVQRRGEEAQRLQSRLASQSQRLSQLEALLANDASTPTSRHDDTSQPQQQQEEEGEEASREHDGDEPHAVDRDTLRSAVANARVAALEEELQAAVVRADAAEVRASDAEHKVVDTLHRLDSELAAAATRLDEAVTSARAESASELDALRVAAATAQKTADDATASASRALSAREAAETESARAQAALRAAENARVNLSQQVAIAEQARRDEAATVVELQRALSSAHGLARSGIARAMWRLAAGRVRQQRKLRAAVHALMATVPTHQGGHCGASAIRLNIVLSPGLDDPVSTRDTAAESGAVAAAEERAGQLQARIETLHSELESAQSALAAATDAASKDINQRVQAAELRATAAEQRAAAAATELQTEAARYKEKLRYFADEVKQRDDAAKADAAVATDLRARLASAEAAARAREEASAATCAAREADLSSALRDAQRQAQAVEELRGHMSQLALARDKAESQLLATGLRVAQLEARARLLDDALSSARSALEREALVRERLETQLAETQAPSQSNAAVEKRAAAAERAAADSAAQLAAAQHELERLRGELATEADSPRMKQLRLRAEEAEEACARVRRELTFVQQAADERCQHAEAQCVDLRAACEQRLAESAAEVEAAGRKAQEADEQVQLLQHKLHALHEEFTAWRERARAWMEAKDEELDVALGKRAAKGESTLQRGPGPMAFPQALGQHNGSAAHHADGTATPVRAGLPSEDKLRGDALLMPSTPSASALPFDADDDRLLYLRNVLLKFMVTSSWATQQRLVPVVATLLRFTDQERAQVAAARQQLALDSSSTALTQLLPSPFR